MLTLRSLALLTVIATAVFLGTVFAWVETAPQSSEIVKERYPNRAVKLERHIAQDQNQNFVNHGPWTMWDPAGNVVAKGSFQSGLRYGEWKRWYYAPEGKNGIAQASTSDLTDVLNSPEFEAFKRPFVSTATFHEDRINGAWTLVDAEGRHMFSVDLDKNVLNGKAVWWHATGKKRREIDFHNGTAEGEWKEWDESGKTLRNDRYLDGCRLAEATVAYDSGNKAAAGVYLHPRENLKVDLDWWIGLVSLTVTNTDGKPLKQGRWQFWFEDGELKCEGEFLDDKPIGSHIWWFSNGQKQCEGSYAEGLPEGLWVHWHENGIRSAQGEYREGKRVGRWMQWDADGKVVQASAAEPSATYTNQITPAPQTRAYRTVTTNTGNCDVNCPPGTVRRGTQAMPAQIVPTPAAPMTSNRTPVTPRH